MFYFNNKTKHKVFAKLNLNNISIWFSFENNNDANDLQKTCHYGEVNYIEWYLFRFNK